AACCWRPASFPELPIPRRSQRQGRRLAKRSWSWPACAADARPGALASRLAPPSSRPSCRSVWRRAEAWWSLSKEAAQAAADLLGRLGALFPQAAGKTFLQQPPPKLLELLLRFRLTRLRCGFGRLNARIGGLGLFAAHAHHRGEGGSRRDIDADEFSGALGGSQGIRGELRVLQGAANIEGNGQADQGRNPRGGVEVQVEAF